MRQKPDTNLDGIIILEVLPNIEKIPVEIAPTLDNKKIGDIICICKFSRILTLLNLNTSDAFTQIEAKINKVIKSNNSLKVKIHTVFFSFILYSSLEQTL